MIIKKLFLSVAIILISMNMAICGEVLYPTLNNPEGDLIKFDDKLSGKDFTNKNLRDIKIIPGTVIYASVFYQENKPDEHIFPEDMAGVSFYNCNLDNVYIPLGNTIIGGTHKKMMVQNDLRDWEIDKDSKPIKVMNEDYWKVEGVSIDVKDIPLEKLINISEIPKTMVEVIE